MSNDHAQSTAMLGSGEKVDSLRHFCIRFQFLQIIPETMRQKDNVNSLYSCAPYPTLSLKTSTEERVEAIFGLCINIYKALGTLYAKQTSNRIAANGCYEPKVTDATFSPTTVWRAQ